MSGTSVLGVEQSATGSMGPSPNASGGAATSMLAYHLGHAHARSSSPSREGSVPGSRWRSRRSPGWCGSSSRPCTATTRSSTTQPWSPPSKRAGVVFVERHRRGAAGRADHAVGARLGARGGGRRRRQGRRHGRRGVPARHQGPPRGEADGRPRASTSSTSATKATTRPSAPSPRRPSAVTLIDPESGSRRLHPGRPGAGRPARPDHPRHVRVGGGARRMPRERYPDAVDRPQERPLLRHHQPPDGGAASGRTMHADPRRRFGELLEHPGAGAGGPQRRGRGPSGRRSRRRRPGLARRTRRGRRHRRSLGARPAGPGRHRRRRPDRGGRARQVTDGGRVLPASAVAAQVRPDAPGARRRCRTRAGRRARPGPIEHDREWGATEALELLEV